MIPILEAFMEFSNSLVLHFPYGQWIIHLSEPERSQWIAQIDARHP